MKYEDWIRYEEARQAQAPPRRPSPAPDGHEALLAEIRQELEAMRARVRAELLAELQSQVDRTA